MRALPRGRIRMLLGRTLRAVPPGMTTPALRAGGRRPSLVPFGIFERNDGRPALLLDGYREYGKGVWRSFWWPTRALLTLRERVVLDDETAALVDELLAARTLPAPLVEFADALARVAGQNPECIVRLPRHDPRLGRAVLAATGTDEQIAEDAARYRNAARAVLEELAAVGVDPARSTFLDAGCGTGCMAFALAGEGVAGVAGVDLHPFGEATERNIAGMRERLAPGDDVTIEEGDLARLAFPDGTFDVLYSSNVVEHLVELSEVFTELRRVLRRGGVAYHEFDPWFGRAGGHSLCTLDLPWGHVRLDEEEFARYVTLHRPHEAADAVAFYTSGFQRPRLTLKQTAAVARGVGFDVLAARRMPVPLPDPHRAWYDYHVLRECRRHYPQVTPADLLAISAKLILRRR